MNIVVTLEHRFDRTPDGAVWTRTTFPYHFWGRYLEVFEHVKVVARVLEVKRAEPSWKRVDGELVTVHAVPHYIGPWQFLCRYRSIRRAIHDAVSPEDAVILRVGSTVARLLYPLLKRRGQPYGVEVVADPWDVFSPGVFHHPLRPFIRHWDTWGLKLLCRGAAAGSYVTQTAFQARYPTAPGVFSRGTSDIELLPEHFAAGPRSWRRAPDPLRLLMVGSLESLLKGPDVLLEALATLRRKPGFSQARLTFVGEGRSRPELEALALRLGLSDGVMFLGRMLEGEAIRRQLDLADLFLLPSRGEGLPRVVVEAMARGLPCISTDVGGIPELLSASYLVPPGDSERLAAKIAQVASDPALMSEMSAENLEISRSYAAEPLRRLRTLFYAEVRARTENR